MISASSSDNKLEDDPIHGNDYRGLTLYNPSSSLEESAAEKEKATEGAKDRLPTPTELARSAGEAGGANVYEQMKGRSDYKPEDFIRGTSEPHHGNAPGDDN